MKGKRIVGLSLAGCVIMGVMAGFYQRSNSSAFSGPAIDSLYKDLTEQQKRSPKYALAGLSVTEGLEANLFASEPTLVNPTNIDVDYRGRVWICEAYNYRPDITGNPTNSEGDRILILEDTDGDGKSDKTTVFYQGKELNAPLGIWVMGNDVIVSQSPYVWKFTDSDGDGKADKKEVIFEGIGGEQHDHGMHAFTFGPDGKLYFNFGNEGGQLLDGKGKSVVGRDGQPIDFKKLKQGMVFRCDPDFKNVEVLANNFRNNFEVAIDSYGTMWQSDNDDDGNKSVRINYVMQHGNYGYTDELTGAGWRANRTNMEDSIPFLHWHLNDPGVVPNLLQTGSGSPTGMVVYEGNLLPKTFRNQMIHCEPGHNVVRSYPVEKSGAGYKASIVNLLEGKRDQWFRPSDVCVAPDGSLIVSDWYDPGVGGHQAKDQRRGRLYRIAPPKTPYKMPIFDFSTPAGAVVALQSPNVSVRYLAWTALTKMGSSAVEELEKLWNNKTNTRMRARALWVLSYLDGSDKKYIESALMDKTSEIRITAIRILAEKQNPELITDLTRVATDPDAQVRRECALALHGCKLPGAASLWATLAKQHDGKDRWYLEALGIGAEGQWDTFFKAWEKVAGPNPIASLSGKDIIWRSRSKESVHLLGLLASDNTVELKKRLRYFRAFDFNPGTKEKSVALISIMNANATNQNEINELALRHLDPGFLKESPQARAALKKLLDSSYGTSTYLELVSRYGLTSENQRLLNLAIAKASVMLGKTAGRQLLSQDGSELIWKTINGEDETKAQAILTAIKMVGSKESLAILQKVALDAKYSPAVRSEAVKSLSGTSVGEDKLLVFLREDKLSAELKTTAAKSLNGAWRKSVKAEAAKYLDGPVTTARKHPDTKVLIGLKGNATKGKEVFSTYCSVCHQVNNVGMDFGPKLSEIGNKLPKEALYDAIFQPNAGIGFGYEGYEVTMKDGSVIAGIIASKTETDLILKFPGGSTQEYKMSKVKSVKQMSDSMMPAGLEDAMTTEQLTDLVEYLSSLKKM